MGRDGWVILEKKVKVPSAGGATCTRKWTMANLQYRLVSCLDNFDPA